MFLELLRQWGKMTKDRQLKIDLDKGTWVNEGTDYDEKWVHHRKYKKNVQYVHVFLVAEDYVINYGKYPIPGALVNLKCEYNDDVPVAIRVLVAEYHVYGKVIAYHTDGKIEVKECKIQPPVPHLETYLKAKRYLEKRSHKTD